MVVALAMLYSVTLLEQATEKILWLLNFPVSIFFFKPTISIIIIYFVSGNFAMPMHAACFYEKPLIWWINLTHPPPPLNLIWMFNFFFEPAVWYGPINLNPQVPVTVIPNIIGAFSIK